jgi:hypothetical protein
VCVKGAARFQENLWRSEISEQPSHTCTSRHD